MYSRTEDRDQNPKTVQGEEPESIRYPLMEDFYTIQGEGFHAGRAAYFIRLAGCDVQCWWCDVKDSWDEEKHPKVATGEIGRATGRERGGEGGGVGGSR